MPKDGLVRLPASVAASMLQALTSIRSALDARLVLRRPEIDRPPEFNRKLDYRVEWRGQQIGRIWFHKYPDNHRWYRLGPWHWYFQIERLREVDGHAPTLESAMADYRRAWDQYRSAQSGVA